MFGYICYGIAAGLMVAGMPAAGSVWLVAGSVSLAVSLLTRGVGDEE